MIENTILCVRWGDKYDHTYVEKLKKQCEEHCSIPFNFYCLTDDPQTEYVYENKDDFYQKEFYTDPEVTGYCETDYTIMLDSFLHQDSAEMIKSINANMNLNINIDKGSVLVDKWRSLNEKFYG